MTSPPPLKGIKVLEFAGLAPGPFAGLLLADSGASVLRIDRAVPGQTHVPGQDGPPTGDMLTRHKSSIAVNLKDPRGVALVKELVANADVLIDPFRPGVLEKLGLGPEVLLATNPRLIYARMTGFRRDGKYAAMAGHDINYLAVSGALGLLGRDGEKPHPPWNILADFAGGGAMLFQAVTLALLSRASSGRGQVVEANMVDGSAYLATFPRQALKTPLGDRGRGRNMLDGGAPWYDTYETKDGRYMSVGALEPQFFDLLIRGLGHDAELWGNKRLDPRNWDELRRLIEDTFKTKTRTEWEAVFDGTDACCVPVLEFGELEKEAGREGDQRPPVMLRETPLLAVQQGVKKEDATVLGQGVGVEGQGYEGTPLGAGDGGEETLRNWVGWSNGGEYEVSKGGLVWKQSKSKL